MPAHKPYDQAKVGEVMQTNYRFLQNLFSEQKKWGPQGQEKTLRDFLLSCADEEKLRTALAAEGINIAAPVRIVLFDVETAKERKFDPPINVANDSFYVLVLPPTLRREPEMPRRLVYIESQSWTGAYYHAVSDGYGM
jgi:hypothetical protein